MQNHSFNVFSKPAVSQAVSRQPSANLRFGQMVINPVTEETSVILPGHPDYTGFKLGFAGLSQDTLWVADDYKSIVKAVEESAQDVVTAGNIVPHHTLQGFREILMTFGSFLRDALAPNSPDVLEPELLQAARTMGVEDSFPSLFARLDEGTVSVEDKGNRVLIVHNQITDEDK